MEKEKQNKTNSEYLQNFKNDIEEFEVEKERIRKIMGEHGGTKFNSRELIANIIFGVATVGIFLAQFIFHLDPTISIEIALFLLSIKIISMIYAQYKHNHFMFWVLNTIEYRINNTYKIVKQLQNDLDKEKKKTEKKKTENRKQKTARSLLNSPQKPFLLMSSAEFFARMYGMLLYCC